ncbi:hypothetical protein ACFX13_039533 [Malus domestica]
MIEVVVVETINASALVLVRHLDELYSSTRGIRIAITESLKFSSQLYRFEIQRERRLPIRLNRNRPEGPVSETCR